MPGVASRPCSLFLRVVRSLVCELPGFNSPKYSDLPVSIYGSRIVAPFISATDDPRDYKGPGTFDRVSKWTYVLPATRMPKSSRVQERNRMNVLATTWHCSEQGHADIPTVQRPKERNWAHMGLRFALLLMLLGQLIPFTAVRANAQNLGTAPAFNKAVQGQQATTVEGTVLNIVNWSCNVIAPVIGIACLGVGAWHYKSGRGFGGWLATGVGLMVISGLGRMAEGFITQAQGIN